RRDGRRGRRAFCERAHSSRLRGKAARSRGNGPGIGQRGSLESSRGRSRRGRRVRRRSRGCRVCMVRLDSNNTRLRWLQLLYQREVTGESISAILESRSYSTENGEPDEFCRTLALGVEQQVEELDSTLGDISEHWAVSRMPMVDRNI